MVTDPIVDRPWPTGITSTGRLKGMALAAGEVCLACSRNHSCTNHVAKPIQALAFGYFEILLRTANRDKIERELARLKSYASLLSSAGYDPDLYADFVEETLELLDRTAASLGCQDGEQKLLASFNNEGVSNSIITHFRVSGKGKPQLAGSCHWLTTPVAHHKCLDEVECCPL